MTDPIAIFEAAYELAGNEIEWLSQVGELVRRNLQDDRWLVATTYDATQPNLITRAMAYCRLDEGTATKMLSTLAVAFRPLEVSAPDRRTACVLQSGGRKWRGSKHM